MSKSIQPVGSTSGVKGQDVEWFAIDLARNDTTKFRISVAVSAAVVIEITKNSGTDWVTLNAGAVLVVNSEFVFDVPIRGGDLFNIRIPTAGGATVRHCRIDRIDTEA